jgi:hypothetical protein
VHRKSGVRRDRGMWMRGVLGCESHSLRRLDEDKGKSLPLR